MTDGQQSYAPDQIDLEDAIKPFVDGKFSRYAVGIGSEISPVELELIAGENVVLAKDFNSLVLKIEQQMGVIGTSVCKGKLIIT